MNFYKTAILTLTGAGMLMGCTHKELEVPVRDEFIDATAEVDTITNRQKMNIRTMAQLEQYCQLNDLRIQSGQEKQR